MQMDINDQMIAQQAETLRLSGAYEQALKIFEQLLQKYRDNAWVNAHLGATYYHLMDYEKAESYLKKALARDDKYFWAHAQLGETYRLRAITENNKRQEYVNLAREHFKKALDNKEPENSNYAWALAHLGATYRLDITKGIRQFLEELISPPSSTEKSLGKEMIQQEAEKAFKYLNRAIELMPTYAWAWGMRATIYRLAKDYKNSFWDVEVEALIAPNIDIMQRSSSPVPSLESSSLSLYEHAFLFFYLTKPTAEKEEAERKRHYVRAIAFLQQALILRPGDSIAKLVLLIIETKQKMEDKPLDSDDIQNIQKKLDEFFEATEVEFSQKCQKVLRYMINAEKPDDPQSFEPEKQSVTFQGVQWIYQQTDKEHKLRKFVLEDVINGYDLKDVDNKKAELWLWKNFAMTEMWAYVLFFLGEAIGLIETQTNTDTKMPYLKLAFLINPYNFTERLYQTPVFSNEDKAKILKNFQGQTWLNFYEDEPVNCPKNN